MEVAFVISSIIVIVVTINIHLCVSFDYNFYKNIGNIKLKIFGIKIFDCEVSLIAGYFNFIRKNRKVVQLKIDLNDANFKFIGDVGEYLIKKTFFTFINSKYQIYGFDPFKISLLSGNMLVIDGIAKSYINARSPDTTVSSDIDVGYVDNYLKCAFDIGVLITIFDFMWAILRAIIKRSFYGKKTRFRRNS